MRKKREIKVNSSRDSYKGYILFSFHLKGFSQSKKVLFSYALHGKKEEKGVLDRVRGKEFGRAVLIIPIKYSDEFTEFLKLWDVKYKFKEVLINEERS